MLKLSTSVTITISIRSDIERGISFIGLAISFEDLKMSTPIKIKQETTEVTDARVKLEGVLQNLVERADESLPLDYEITIKDEQDLERSFDDDIRELDSTPSKKSPSKSRKRRKREFQSSDGELLDDGNRGHNSFVMKLFDRSVDLAQFRSHTSLYPVCRAWMANTPTAKVPRREGSPSPEPIDLDASENGLIYRLPSPSQTSDEMLAEVSRDPRIPSPVPQPEEKLDIHADVSQAPTKETLLNDHLQRWKVIRNKWKDASQVNQSRYSESYALLKAMYERQ